MKKIPLVIPELKNVLGPELSNYPQGFMWPYTVIVREAWWNHRKAIEDTGAEFTVHKYGVLEMKGREYTFRPSAEYAKTKDYPPEISGVWG